MPRAPEMEAQTAGGEGDGMVLFDEYGQLDIAAVILGLRFGWSQT